MCLILAVACLTPSCFAFDTSSIATNDNQVKSDDGTSTSTQSSDRGVSTFQLTIEAKNPSSDNYDLRGKTSVTASSSIATILHPILTIPIRPTDRESFVQVAKRRGFFHLRAKVVGNDPSSSTFVETSVPMCAVLANRGNVDLSVHVGQGNTIVGMDAVASSAAHTDCGNGESLTALNFRLQAHMPHLGVPVRYPMGSQENLIAMRASSISVGQIPQGSSAQAAGTTPTPPQVGPDGKPVPEEKSFLAKYWHFILPIVIAMLFTRPPEEEPKEGDKEERRPQGDGSQRRQDAQASRPRG